jgi:hypothetical protein
MRAWLNWKPSLRASARAIPLRISMRSTPLSTPGPSRYAYGLPGSRRVAHPITGQGLSFLPTRGEGTNPQGTSSPGRLKLTPRGQTALESFCVLDLK